MAARHYLDHASTSPLRPAARRAIEEWLATGAHGDPSRVHTEGREARVALEVAREQVAGLLGARPREVVFASGATEAIAAAVFGAALARPGAPIVCTGVEHSAVRDASRRAAPVAELRVDRAGRVDLGHLDELLGVAGAGSGSGSWRGPALVHCQWGNHEVGTLQPVREVVERCRERGVLVHVDAAAAAGHVEVDFDGLGADLCSVSAHKLGGPPGAGALLVRRGLRLEPLLAGGAQERGRRGGFENTIGVVGFGAAAAELAAPGRVGAEAATARQQTEALLAAALRGAGGGVDGGAGGDTGIAGGGGAGGGGAGGGGAGGGGAGGGGDAAQGAGEGGDAAQGAGGVEVLGDPLERLPHIVCLSVAGVESEAVVLGLDRAGIAVHSGSACSSEALEPSPVLAAMGVEAERSLRVSTGWDTTDADVAAFAGAFGEVLRQLRGLGAASAGGAG